MPTMFMLDVPQVVVAGQVTLEGTPVFATFDTDVWTLNTFDLTASCDYMIFLISSRRQANASSVVFGGQSATLKDAWINDGDSIHWRTQAWYLLAANLPSPGTDIACAVTMTQGTRGILSIVGLKGAAQQAPSSNGGEAVATSISNSVTCPANGIAFQAITKDDTELPTEGQGTRLYRDAIASADACMHSYVPSLGPSATLSASWGALEQVAQGLWGVAPA